MAGRCRGPGTGGRGWQLGKLPLMIGGRGWRWHVHYQERVRVAKYSKVLGGQSQNLVAYGLELREYFANLITNLAIWQTALWCLARRCIVAPRCVQCGATTCNAVQRRAMQCNEVQCSAGGYVQCVQRATTALRTGGRGWPGWIW